MKTEVGARRGIRIRRGDSMKESRIVNEFIWDGNKIIMPSWFPNRVRVDYVKVEKSELSKTDYKQLILTTQKKNIFKHKMDI